MPFYHHVGNRVHPQGRGSMKDMIAGKGIEPPADFCEISGALQQARRLVDAALAAAPHSAIAKVTALLRVA